MYQVLDPTWWGLYRNPHLSLSISAYITWSSLPFPAFHFTLSFAFQTRVLSTKVGNSLKPLKPLVAAVVSTITPDHSFSHLLLDEHQDALREKSA